MESEVSKIGKRKDLEKKNKNQISIHKSRIMEFPDNEMSLDTSDTSFYAYSTRNLDNDLNSILGIGEGAKNISFSPTKLKQQIEELKMLTDSSAGETGQQNLNNFGEKSTQNPVNFGNKVEHNFFNVGESAQQNFNKFGEAPRQNLFNFRGFVLNKNSISDFEGSAQNYPFHSNEASSSAQNYLFHSNEASSSGSSGAQAQNYPFHSNEASSSRSNGGSAQNYLFHSNEASLSGISGGLDQNYLFYSNEASSSGSSGFIGQTISQNSNGVLGQFSDAMKFLSKQKDPEVIIVDETQENKFKSSEVIPANKIIFQSLNVTDNSGNVIELKISHELPSYQEPEASMPTAPIPAERQPITGVQCDKCPKICKDTRYLKQHKAEKHKDGLNCRICNRISPTLEKLEYHEKMHDDRYKRFKCKDCHLKFTSNQTLQRHYSSVHERDTLRYQCEMCDYKSYRKDQFLKHERIHSNVKTKKTRKPKKAKC